MLCEDGDEPISWRDLLAVNQRDIAPIVDAKSSWLRARILGDRPLGPSQIPQMLTPEDENYVRRLIESISEEGFLD